ncbi:MAG: Fic family protein [Bacteroidota bacterium]|nr:Fic family protein [Bacteroidota bacterium]
MWEELKILRSKYLDLQLDQVIDYEKFSMISIVYNSTKIEGCSLSEFDTRMLLEKDITAKGKPLSDHLMVKDHFAAFRFIKEQAVIKRRLSQDLIQEVAAMVMKNTGGPVSSIAGDFDTSKGELRKVQVYVDHKYFPDYSKVSLLLDKLLKSINSKLDHMQGTDILKLAADIHFYLVNIHPFGDGNGRTSRLMMNYIQLFHGEPLIKVFTEDRAQYINALNQTEEKDDIDIFRNFIGEQQLKFFSLELEKYKNKDKGMVFML